MKSNNFTKRLFAFLVLACMLLTTMVGCGSQDAGSGSAAGTEQENAPKVESAADLDTAKIGVQIGTTGDIVASEKEETGATIERFQKGADAIQALKTGKLDCVVIDEQPAKAFVKNTPGLKILDEEFVKEDYAICAAKGNTELIDEVNAALKTLRENGTLDQIVANYIGDDTKGTCPYESPADVKRDNGTLIVATNAEFEPYEFMSNGKIVGIDMEMAQAIADIMGRELKIDNIQFDAIITSVSTGKADLGIAGMTVTEDRLKNIDFSDSYTTSKQVIIVRDEAVQETVKIDSIDDLDTAKIGVQIGTTGDIYASDKEETGATIERFQKGADAVQALKTDKINCVVIDEQPAKSFVANTPGLKILDEEFVTEDYAICAAKGNTELLTKVNAALKTLKENGTLDQIVANYIGDDTKGTCPYESPADVKRDNGTLIVATNAEFEPYEFMSDGKIVGIDMEMAQAIADILGMDLKIENIQFDAIITSVSSGKADLGIAGMTVTEDRLKNIDFSDPYTTSKQVVIVKSDESASTGLSFKEKLYQNFIEENRWQYITRGLMTTIIIAFFALVIGLVLGFLIAIIRSACDMTGKAKVINWICKAYLTIIRGTPSMIQLLIIYYVIFASTSIDKVLVACVAFGLNSSAYIAEIVRSGIMSIDQGQMEAGRSLGFNFRQTMCYIILPQAFKNVLPALGNEFIVLLKETSISGYIGISDLTRGGDYIRSRTYEAFIPLVAVAIIYLILVMALSAAVGALERRLRNNEQR